MFSPMMHACFLGFTDMLVEYALFSFTFGSISFNNEIQI